METEVAVEKFVASLEGTELPAVESEPVVVVHDLAVVEDAVEDEAAAAGSPADDTILVDHNSAACTAAADSVRKHTAAADP